LCYDCGAVEVEQFHYCRISHRVRAIIHDDIIRQEYALRIRKREEVKGKMLQELRNANPEGVSLEEAVSLVAHGEAMLEVYEGLAMEAPEWIKDKVGALKKDLASKRRDNLEKAIKDAKRSLEDLKSKEEKKADVEAKLRALEAKLAGTP
jgi:hypothetical protein